VRSTFASGLSNPWGLAFNSAGDLFETDEESGNIYKFTPGGVRSTFASGFGFGGGGGLDGLAFNNAGNLFVVNYGSGNIYEFTPGGVRSTFASGLKQPTFIAFQGQTLPVPEPSGLGLVAIGTATLLVCRRSH
jgi:DNA-binding beta-propeller fold protein YncE